MYIDALAEEGNKSPQPSFVVRVERILAFPQSSTVDKIERMGGCFEANSTAGIHQQLAGWKDVVAIPRFGTVKEEVPLHDEKRDIERIEKRKSREPPFQIGIQKHEVAA